MIHRILAAFRSTPQAQPRDLPAQDEVEVVAREIHEHLSRRDIMQYLDNDEDCRGLATASIAALDRHRAGDDALREENARLREALKSCRKAVSSNADEPRRNVREIVDEALECADRAALTGRQG